MPVSLTQQTFRAPTGMALRRPSDNSLLVTPAPSNISINPGLEEVITETRNPLGERVNASSYIDANKPIITTTLPGYTLETLGIRLGKKFTVPGSAQSTTIEQLITVTNANKVKAAAASGVVGNGMTADQAGSIGFVLGDNGLSTALTRVDTASFDAADPTSFSQGADGAYQLTDDLVGSTVLLQFPISVTQPRLSETIDQFFDINITLVNIQGTMYKLQMASAQTDLTGSGDLNFGEASLAFRGIYDGSTCQPIMIQSLGQVLAC